MAKMNIKNIILACLFIASFNPISAMEFEIEEPCFDEQQGQALEQPQKQAPAHPEVLKLDQNLISKNYEELCKSFYPRTNPPQFKTIKNTWLTNRTWHTYKVLIEQERKKELKIITKAFETPMLYLASRLAYKTLINSESKDGETHAFGRSIINLMVRMFQDIYSLTNMSCNVNTKAFNDMQDKVLRFWINSLYDCQYANYDYTMKSILLLFYPRAKKSKNIYFKKDLPSFAWSNELKYYYQSTINFKSPNEDLEAMYKHNTPLIDQLREKATRILFHHLYRKTRDIENKEKWKAAFSTKIEELPIEPEISQEDLFRLYNIYS